MFGLVTLRIASQASLISSGSLLTGSLLIITAIAVFAGIKCSSRFKDVVALIFMLFVLTLPFLQYGDSLGYIVNSSSMMMLTSSILCLLLFGGVCFYIYSISKKISKSKKDVASRKKAVSSLAFIFAAALSLLYVSFSITMLLDPTKNVYLSSWIRSVTVFALLSTMAVILCDNMVGRICSPVYTTDIIEKLKTYNLYLRSFEADVTHKKKEKILCKTFNYLFPTYAIGDPNSVLQPVGAFRIYATDSEWQEAVASLMEKARIILIRCALTDGTIWELERLLSRYQLFSKSVFILDNEDCYTFLKKEFSAKGVIAEFPDIQFTGSQYALFISGNDIGWDINACKIDTEKEVSGLVNQILSRNKKIDGEYEKILRLRREPYVKIFSNEIPKEIRHSLNWGILSALFNWRHWPVSFWIVYMVLGISSAVLLKSNIVIYIILILAFLFGNRLEWTQTSHAGVALFLSKQYREALLMWYSMIFTGIMAWIAIMLVL